MGDNTLLKKVGLKSKSGSPSHRGLAFLVMGFLLISTPYIVEHCGYTGEILIADDQMQKPFDKSLVFVVQQDIGGAAGVIINKPLSAPLHEQLAPFIKESGIPVSYGGPIGLPDRIVVLEEKDPVTPGGSPQYDLNDWDAAVHDTPDLLNKIRESLERGEQRYRLFAGLTAWGPFQLESETLVKGEWYAMQASHDLVFQNGSATKWDILEPTEKVKHAPKSNQS
jgi:putative transcriptional regulator